MSRTFGLKISTRLTYDELDSILAQYCRSSYRIHLGGLNTSTPITRKIMIISCGEAEDRDRIKTIFAMRGAVNKPTERPLAAPPHNPGDKPAEKQAAKATS